MPLACISACGTSVGHYPVQVSHVIKVRICQSLQLLLHFTACVLMRCSFSAMSPRCYWQKQLCIHTGPICTFSLAHREQRQICPSRPNHQTHKSSLDLLTTLTISMIGAIQLPPSLSVLHSGIFLFQILPLFYIISQERSGDLSEGPK